jgi:sRNA-binding carbon storage regulator CsrA
MYLIDEIRKFDIDSVTAIEDLVALSAIGRAVQNEFVTLAVEAPEFLDVKLADIRREIRSRNADRIQKLIREKKSRLESLLPAEEKRQALKDEIDRLEKQAAGQ